MNAYNPNLPDWMPQTPGMFQAVDPETGLMKDQFQVSAPQLKYSNNWLNMQMKKQGIEQQGLLDQAGGNANIAATSGIDRLAQTGGVGAGDRARFMNSAGRNAMFAKQGIANQGALQRMDLGLADEARKLDINKYNNNMQFQADQLNIGNALNWLDKGNQQNWNTWDIATRGIAAERAGDAMGEGGGGGMDGWMSNPTAKADDWFSARTGLPSWAFSPGAQYEGLNTRMFGGGGGGGGGFLGLGG